MATMKLRLSKGSSFAKSRLLRYPQEDAVGRPTFSRSPMRNTSGVTSASAVFPNVLCEERVTPTGSELSADSQAKTAVLEIGGATGGAVLVDLEQIAADLRSRLTADECRRLADLLNGD